MTLHRNPYSQLLVSFQQSLISGRRSSVLFSVRRSLGNERIEPPRESDGMVIPIAGSGGEPWSNVAQNVHTPGLHERRQCRVHSSISIYRYRSPSIERSSREMSVVCVVGQDIGTCRFEPIDGVYARNKYPSVLFRGFFVNSYSWWKWYGCKLDRSPYLP